MNTNILLSPEQILKATQTNEELTFSNDFDLIYERQLLPGVIILVEGELQFLSSKNFKKITASGSLIGWESILKNKKSKYRLRIMAGSRILLIGRSGLNELQEIIIDEKVSKAEICR